MIKIPKLPEKEELEFKEKEFLLSVYEMFQSSSRIWFYLLVVILILAFPMKLILESELAKYFISFYKPPVVNLYPYTPQEIEIRKTQILPVSAGVVSLYAQIYNPNLDVSARSFNYQFILEDRNQEALKTIGGSSYLFAGESKFLLIPTLNFSGEIPVSVDLILKDIKWTRWSPKLQVNTEILQKNSGLTLEKKFFVEGLLRNSQGFTIKKVEVVTVLLDITNQDILGVNSTVLTDLKPLESRYFRMVWPYGRPVSLGDIQILSYLNPFDPGLILEFPEIVPGR